MDREDESGGLTPLHVAVATWHMGASLSGLDPLGAHDETEGLQDVVFF